MAPTTSSKSVSATPLATKRGAQCERADLTRASSVMGEPFSKVDGASLPEEVDEENPRNGRDGKLAISAPAGAATVRRPFVGCALMLYARLKAWSPDW